MGRRFKKLPAYIPPPSYSFHKLIDDEREAIARGETEGLDPTEQYVAMRVGREKQMPVWVVARSPVDATGIDGVVLFVAAVTLGTAIEMVRNGAEVWPVERR